MISSLFTAIAVYMVEVALGALVLMTGMQALHDSIAAVPAMGYMPCYAVSLPLVYFAKMVGGNES